MTLGEAIERLRTAGVDSPEYDARELFRHFLRLSRSEIIRKDTNFQADELQLAVERREKREPLQYIIGETGFFRESYLVDPSVLIPRADTEVLVEYAVDNIPDGETFLDLCTGSGCIAISTLANTRNTRAVAVDISDAALALARKNAERIGVLDRISFIRKDLLCEDIPDGEYYAILSNPPYIPKEVYEGLSPEIFLEPSIAFVGGDCGMEFYKRLLPLSLKKLKNGGFIAFEIGFDQGEKMISLAHSHGCACRIIKDYSGNDRVAVVTR